MKKSKNQIVDFVFGIVHVDYVNLFKKVVNTILLLGEQEQRWPSAAARDQHPSLEEKDLLRTMLSRRQQQGFVGLRGDRKLNGRNLYSFQDTNLRSNNAS